MYKVFSQILLSFFAVSAMTTQKPPQGSCNVIDEIVAEVYNDPYFQRPENRRQRDDLVRRIISNDDICDDYAA